MLVSLVSEANQLLILILLLIVLPLPLYEHDLQVRANVEMSACCPAKTRKSLDLRDHDDVEFVAAHRGT